MPSFTKPENINSSYFDGYYKDIWRSIIPKDFTTKEIDFLVDYFNLKPGHHVLDIMCGYGRHAIGLARKGIAVTAVDNLEDYIDEIKQIEQKEKLPITTVCSDVLRFKPEKTFDLCICMGNSLNFFDAGETHHILSLVSSHLNSGGKFLINTWSLTEIVSNNFKSRSWERSGDLIFLTECKFLFQPARIETESVIMAPDGTSETKKAVDYIFSVNEMEGMLEKAGFILKENYSIPGKKKFTLGEPRAYLIAEKR